MALSGWVAALGGPVLLGLSLMYWSRGAWMGLAFCFNGWGDWLDVRGQQRGVRSGWRLVSRALGVVASGVWLWLELRRAG